MDSSLKPLNTSTTLGGNISPSQYKVVSEVEYDKSLCEGITDLQSGLIRGGVRIYLVESDSGASIPGFGALNINLTSDPAYSHLLDSGDDSSSAGIGQEGGYTCYEGLASNGSTIITTPAGHCTSSFDLSLPENKLVTIRVFVDRNTTTNNHHLCPEQEEWFQKSMEESFGLGKLEYTLTSINFDPQRGGFIKVTGVYKNSTPFDVFYHWGWCSSGGTDCGWVKCFKVTGDDVVGAFEKVKTSLCKGISSQQTSDGYYCSGKEYDNTTILQGKCLSGAYEYESNGSKTISIKQDSGRCGSTPSKGLGDCLEYKGGS
jgi:hypothetical protein